MENQLKVKKAKSLNKYINEKRNQDECLGFIHGYEQALEDIKAPEMFEMLKTIYNIENGAFKLNSFNIELFKSQIKQLLKEATEL